MPPLTTGSVARSLAPGYRGIIGTRLGGRESHYTRMYNVETSVRAYEDWFAATGLPIAGEKPEGTPIQAYDPIEGGSKRLTHKTYAIAFEVTEEAYEDDLYKNAGSAQRAGAEGLADGFAERVELEAHRPFNIQGFDDATWLVLPDNSGFFSTAHNPIAGGQGIAQANEPATNADLNVTSYRAMFTTFRRYRDDQGKRIPNVTRLAALEVPPELRWNAEEIVYSSNRPDTANRVENVSPRINVQENPYLDDTNSWFGRAMKHFCIFLWRKRPTLDSFDDPRTRTAVFLLYGRFSYGPIHWLGYYGSEGA